MLPLTRTLVLTVALTLTFTLADQCEAASRFLDFTVAGGAGKASVSTDAATPSNLPVQVGTSLGFSVMKVVRVGLTSRYSLHSQTATVGAEGNRTGSRWSVASPLIGVEFGRILIRGTYEWIGDYQLRFLTAAGASVRYSTPRGFSGEAILKLGKRLGIGGFFQQVEFSTEVAGDVTTSLIHPLRLSSYGGMLRLSL